MNLYLAFALMLLGIAGQFAARMATLEDAGKVPTPLEYVRAHPWRCFNMLFASGMMVVISNQLGQLNPMNAIFIGYMCQDMADRLRIAAGKRLGPP